MGKNNSINSAIEETKRLWIGREKMMANLNNRVKAELVPIDVRLMKHYDTTYTRDGEGRLVVCNQQFDYLVQMLMELR